MQNGRQVAILEVMSLKINRLLPMTTVNMHMKFEIETPKQTWLYTPETMPPSESRNWKKQYGFQAAMLKMTLLKINRLLPIYINIVPLKFGVDIQRQIKVRVRKPKNPIWPPGGHFESDFAENQ